MHMAIGIEQDGRDGKGKIKEQRDDDPKGGFHGDIKRAMFGKEFPEINQTGDDHNEAFE